MKYETGQRFTAKIEGTPVKGTISVNLGNVYLCNDLKEGTSTDDKQGHKFSWTVENGFQDRLSHNLVKDFKILTEEEYLNYELPFTNTVFGYDIEDNGEAFSFGCGEVTISKETIRQFIKGVTDLKQIKREELIVRQPFTTQINALRRAEEEAIAGFVSQINEIGKNNVGFTNVMEILKARNLTVDTLSVKHLEYLFGEKTVEA